VDHDLFPFPVKDGDRLLILGRKVIDERLQHEGGDEVGELLPGWLQFPLWCRPQRLSCHGSSVLQAPTVAAFESSPE
jgi:hypothetical protein